MKRCGVMVVISLLMALSVAAVTDFSLIAPQTLRGRGLDPQQVRNCYVNASRKHPNDAVRLMHLAEHLDLSGNPTAAIPYAERAVTLFRSEPPTLVQEAVWAAHQYKLAETLFHADQPKAAAEILAKNSTVISDFIPRLSSRDPKVQDEFRKLAAERAELAKRIGEQAANPPSAKP